LRNIAAGFGLRAAINRCSVIAGPWQMGKVDQGVVALWVLRHFFGKPLKYIGYGGTGKQVRDMLHVADLCELVEEQISDFDRLGRLAGKCRRRTGSFRFARGTDRHLP
jgi:CDP-paratose 2-epimerase